MFLFQRTNYEDIQVRLQRHHNRSPLNVGMGNLGMVETVFSDLRQFL